MAIKLGDYFECIYGVNLEFNKMNEVNNGIPFVSRTEKNNGVCGFVEEIDNIEPNPANTISVAVSGSVLESFLQKEPYYSGRDLYYLLPKQNFTDNELLFYCMHIKANAYKYSYGRQANKTLKNILIPSKNEIPDWVYETNIKASQKKPFLNDSIELNTENWEWFELKKLFSLDKGTRLTKANRKKGDIPLVTAGKINEGIAEYISNEKMKHYQNAITVDMFANCFYKEYVFCCDDNILVLSNENLNKYSGVFIASIIKFDIYKFQYGRQYRQKNFKQHKIKLPIKSDGSLDWQFMENYIKGLPYSKCL